MPPSTGGAKPIKLIAAVAQNGAIGLGGRLPCTCLRTGSHAGAVAVETQPSPIRWLAPPPPPPFPSTHANVAARTKGWACARGLVPCAALATVQLPSRWSSCSSATSGVGPGKLTPGTPGTHLARLTARLAAASYSHVHGAAVHVQPRGGGSVRVAESAARGRHAGGPGRARIQTLPVRVLWPLRVCWQQGRRSQRTGSICSTRSAVT